MRCLSCLSSLARRSAGRRCLGGSCASYVPFPYPAAHTLTTHLQDNSRKCLHYVDSATRFGVRKGFEDLPDRIDLSMVSEVATGTCVPYQGQQLPSVDMAAMPTSPLTASPLSFSLLTASGSSLADQIATDQARWADWTDGLNMLRKDGAHVASRETENFIQALTEIGLKIKLLGASLLSVRAFDQLCWC